MDVREKLVELQSIITCPNAICNFCEHFKNKGACEKHKKEVVADNMIANGVTVQEWISVKDRLPEAYNLVLAVCKSGKIFVGEYVDLGWRTLWRIKTARDSTKEITQIVTHWMPLPEPPKGE